MSDLEYRPAMPAHDSDCSTGSGYSSLPQWRSLRR